MSFVDNTRFRNGAEWLRIRSVFQRGLSSPISVLNFLSPSNDVMQEWIEDRLQKLCVQSDIDYLPELSRLFLECMFLVQNKFLFFFNIIIYFDS